MRQLSFLAQKENTLDLMVSQMLRASISLSQRKVIQENHEHLYQLGISDWRCVSELKTSSRSAEELRKSFSASLGGSSRDSIRTAPLH